MLTGHPTWINPLTPLAGRDADVGAVVEALSRSRLVTLTGLPGVGKSRLAAAVCAAQGEWLMMDLSAHTLAEIDVSEVGAAVGVFLDNFERRSDTFSTLNGWFHRHPRLKVMVTARTRLGLPGEWVHEVSPLALMDACALLRHLVQGANPRLRSLLDDETIRALAVRVGGIPLAIEWVAQALRVHEPQHLATAHPLLPYLVGPHRDPGLACPSMAAAFETVVCGLSANARATLQALCVFEGGFTTAMAAEVLGVPHDETSTSLLGELVDASLLADIDMGEANGFGIHPLLREYVWMTTDADVMQGHQRSLLRWAESFVDRGFRTLSPPQFLHHLGMQEVNLFRAVMSRREDSIFEQRDSLLSAHLLRLLGHRGELKRAHELATSLIDQAQCSGQERARLRLERAKLAIRGGDLPSAATDVAQLSCSDGEAHISYVEVRALLARRQGNVQDADTLYADAIALCSHAGDTYRAGLNTSERASLAFETRDVARAKLLFASAKDLMHSAGREPDAKLLTNLALLYQEEGALLQAEQSLLQALDVHRQDGNRRFVAITLGDLAGLAFEQGCGAKAASLYAAAQAAPADAWDSEHIVLVGAARNASLATLHLSTAKALPFDVNSVDGSIRPAVATYIAIERYLDRCKAGQWQFADQGYAEELEQVAGHAWAGMRDEVRLALRIAERYRQAPKLLIRADGAGFWTDESAWIDLRRRPLLGRLLVALARNRLEDASAGLRACDLIDRGWPGERMREDAAANRLYVALSELRKLGLAPLFPNTRERYRLSDATAVLMCPPTSPTPKEPDERA